MKGSLLLVVSCILLAYVHAIPTQLTYQMGQQYIYTVSGAVDSRGDDVTNNQRTPGSQGFLYSTMVMEPVSSDATSYTFVMNMFNTVVSVNQSVSAPAIAPAAGSTPLGDDMYFQQHVNGTIMQIWYNTADSPFYINVKISSINSFQTHLVNVGENKDIDESDVVGLHSSNVVGSAGNVNNAALLVAKNFNQNDITEFVDPTLNDKDVQITANGAVGLHNDGYAVYSYVEQMTAFMNTNSQKSAKRDMTNSTGFDMNLSSMGSLTHTLASTTASLTYPLKSKPDATMYTQTTLTGGAAVLVARALKEAHTLSSVKKHIVAAVERERSTAAAITALAAVGRHIQYNPEDAEHLVPYLRAKKHIDNVEIRDRVYYVLSVAQHSEYLVKFGLRSTNPAVRTRAVLACAHLEKPTQEIVELLRELSNGGNAVATNVFGIAVGKSNDDKSFKELLTTLMVAISADNEPKIIAMLNALGNAGPIDSSAASLVEFGELAFNHRSVAVRAAAAYAMRKYNTPKVAEILRNILTQEASPVVAKICAKILTEKYSEEAVELSTVSVGGSDFPFNKTFDKDLKFGGDVVGADFSVNLIAGTNFDCSQPTFNYEVSAEAKASASLFGVSQEVFDASAIYGKDNGAALADMMQLSVWGDVIYTKNFPQVDCSQHTYPIAHAAPGYSVSYTLWVSIVPIVFSAELSVVLDLQWGWQVCDSSLSAMVEIVPSGSVVASGTVTIDLLLLRAGVNLQASFNEQVTPQLYIHGSECSLGLQVEEDAQPMDAAFTSYYEWRECKFLIFDCHWGQHNQQNWWSWTRPAVSRVLFNEEYKITP